MQDINEGNDDEAELEKVALQDAEIILAFRIDTSALLRCIHTAQTSHNVTAAVHRQRPAPSAQAAVAASLHPLLQRHAAMQRWLLASTAALAAAAAPRRVAVMGAGGQTGQLAFRRMLARRDEVRPNRHRQKRAKAGRARREGRARRQC